MKQMSIHRYGPARRLSDSASANLITAAIVTMILCNCIAAQPVLAADARSRISVPALTSGSQIPNSLTFNVWLDERPMGQHRYTFDQSNQRLRVTSEADFNVKVVFVTVFSYAHRAIETWAGNCLRALTSNTTTNGESEAIELDIPDTDCAGTYTYWDKERLQRPVLLNAQTAETEPAMWTDLGLSTLPTIGKRKTVHPQPDRVSAVALKTPSAEFMLYYNANDELLMMQTDNDGRTITYLHDSLTLK